MCMYLLFFFISDIWFDATLIFGHSNPCHKNSLQCEFMSGSLESTTARASNHCVPFKHVLFAYNLDK